MLSGPQPGLGRAYPENLSGPWEEAECQRWYSRVGGRAATPLLLRVSPDSKSVERHLPALWEGRSYTNSTGCKEEV